MLELARNRLALAMPARRLYISTHGHGQRDPRPTGGHASPRGRRPQDTVASRAAGARNGPRPAFLRRQEPGLLDPAIDRLGRLLPPSILVGLRQFDGLDVPGPHAAVDGDRLFADFIDGLALSAADQD